MPDKTGITSGETMMPPGAMKKVSVSANRKFMVTLITLVMLAGGVTLAALHGDLLMRAGTMQGSPMSMPKEIEQADHDTIK